ncbi:MAG: hypothetical protein IT363_10600 [Methanoregulaceae archaeon]|nr:hypothetical protein [Methanoregulaceae archaeon]
MKNVGFVIAGLVLAGAMGCGGSGSPAAIAPDPEVGGSQVRVAGKMSNQIASTAPGGLAVFGFTGAITKAYWSDANPTPEEGEIVVKTRTPRGPELRAMELDGTNQRVIATLSASAENIAVSPDGAWLYFVENYTLKRTPMAGGTPATILTDVFDFCLTPSGSKVVVHRPVAQALSVINSNGSGLVDRISGVPVDTDVIGCSTENHAYFARDVSGSAPQIRGFTLGGTLVNDALIAYANAAYSGSVIDAKRESLYYSIFDISSGERRWYAIRLTSGTGGYLHLLRSDLDPNVEFRSMQFLPDDSKMLVMESAQAGAFVAFASDQRYVINRVVQLTDNFSKAAFAPAPTFRTLVGAGNYASGAAMAMFSEKGNRTPAVVLADCTTRASMTLTRISDDNDGTLIYQIGCDNLTKLHYTKSNSFAQVGVIGSLIGLKGAFIAFNAETGRVSNIVTFTKKPSVKRTPQGIVLEGGELVDHFDGDGKRKPVAPRITF